MLLSDIIGTDPPGVYVEYMENGPVVQFLQQFDVTWEWKLQILYDVSLAMAYLNEQKPRIIHGDLKCKNILIGKQFHAKITGFGFAEEVSSSSVDTEVCGSLVYLAPECLECLGYPKKIKNEKTDVYSFAISAWEIFSQKFPYFDYPDQESIGKAVMLGKRPLITFIQHPLPSSILKLIVDCWHARNDNRPTFEMISQNLACEISSIQTELERSYLNLLIHAFTREHPDKL